MKLTALNEIKAGDLVSLIEGGVVVAEATKCERCGRPMQHAPCEHCWETITTKVEQWNGFTVHSTERRRGSMIFVDEFAVNE